MVLCGFIGLSSRGRIWCRLYFVCYRGFWRCFADCVQVSVISLFSWGFVWFWVGIVLCGDMGAWWLFLMWLMADFDVVMADGNGACWGGDMGVIWGLEVVGFCWFLGWFWLRNCCSESGVSCWYFVSILFDYLYLFHGLYWWISVCSVDGMS